MKVVGIDPAPGKDSTVFDGQGSPRNLGINDLRQYLQTLASGAEPVLLCWDAPLSGPRSTGRDEEYGKGDMTLRSIDRFFRVSESGYKTPKGVSVLPYGGCAHWTISRALLGLPRLGPYDAVLEDLPFDLVSRNNLLGSKPKQVVEVHPAVAIWLWCGGPASDEQSWRYKRDTGKVNEIWRLLRDRLPSSCRAFGERRLWSANEPLHNDDELDALVAWVLGFIWLQGEGDVILLGDQTTGSLLLPNHTGLAKAFSTFQARQ